MITDKDRLAFEAAHKVPDDLVYSYETKSYVAKARHYGFSAPIYNAMLQGFQSGLEASNENDLYTFAWNAAIDIAAAKLRDNLMFRIGEKSPNRLLCKEVYDDILGQRKD